MSIIVGRNVTGDTYFIEVNGQREMISADVTVELINTLIGLIPDEGDFIPGEDPVPETMN